MYPKYKIRLIDFIASISCILNTELDIFTPFA